MAVKNTVNTDQSNNQTPVPLPNADPTADVQNSEVIFHVDDSTNELLFKAKDSTGDAISGNVGGSVTLSAVNDWTGQQNFIESTLTDAALISWDLSTNQNAKVTLTASRTMNAPTNLKAGGKYTLRVIQDGTGGWAIAFDSVFSFPNGVLPPQNTSSTQDTVYYFYSDGTNMIYVASSEPWVPTTASTGDIISWNGTEYVTISPGANNTSLSSNGPGVLPSYKSNTETPGSIIVEDGSTTVSPASTIEFTSGATVTDAGNGKAQVSISGGGGTITEWVSFTPVITGCGTISSAVGKWRRVGDSMDVEGSFVSGTTTAVPFEIDIPSSEAIDTTKISGGNMNTLGRSFAVGVGIYAIPAHLFSDGSDTSAVYASYQAASNANFTKANGNALVSSGQGYCFQFTVPISGWSV